MCGPESHARHFRASRRFRRRTALPSGQNVPMKRDDLEAALRASIDDRHITRGERKALRALVEDNDLDAHQRTQLRSKAFEIARQSVDAPQAREVLDWLQDVVGIVAPLEGRGAEPPPEEVERGAWFSPGQAPLEAIVSQMRRVRRSADICVFTITDDRISDGILGIANRGVKVRVISDDDKAGDRGSDLRRLVDAGIAVAFDRTEAHMHHKFAIFDDARLMTGSFNWTRSASSNNHENILVTSSIMTPGVVTSRLERLWTMYTSA